MEVFEERHFFYFCNPGLADGKVIVDQILKKYKSTSPYMHNKHELNITRGLILGKKYLDFN